MVINWRDPLQDPARHAIIFAPETEDEFDREIEKAFGGKPESHRPDEH